MVEQPTGELVLNVGGHILLSEDVFEDLFFMFFSHFVGEYYLSRGLFGFLNKLKGFSMRTCSESHFSGSCRSGCVCRE